MSGMAAAIRLSMFNKNVLLLEKHTLLGGLNSYYPRGKRIIDVGLHALTNFVPKGSKKAPLIKLLKQLRIPYDDLNLQEQTYSQMVMGDEKLSFTNHFEHLEQEIKKSFPLSYNGFQALVERIRQTDEVALVEETFLSARSVLQDHIQDAALIEMLLMPLLIYGSAWEDDMEFKQFCIMFKSLYFEGFAYPLGGVKPLIDLLKSKIESLAVDLRLGVGVEKILVKDNKAIGILSSKGEEIFAAQIFSTIGRPETEKLLGQDIKAKAGALAFVESIAIFKKLKSTPDFTISFFNDWERYCYRSAAETFDDRSAVVCLPFNYERNTLHEEFMVRVTMLANYKKWKSLDKDSYRKEKDKVFAAALGLMRKNGLEFSEDDLLFKDVFTPTTIERFTNRADGAIYGSPDKLKQGKMELDHLYLCGTDQGFLGIVGALLSGISMANLYGLMGENSAF